MREEVTLFVCLHNRDDEIKFLNLVLLKENISIRTLFRIFIIRLRRIFVTNNQFQGIQWSDKIKAHISFFLQTEFEINFLLFAIHSVTEGYPIVKRNVLVVFLDDGYFELSVV